MTTSTISSGDLPSSAFSRALRDAAGGDARVSIDPSDRVATARDLWPRHLIDLRAGRAAGTQPQAVVWPTCTDEVAKVVAFCAREGVPIVPYGAGSGVCGGVLPDARTVVLDMKRMKRWRRLDREAPTLDIEAGAMGITLEEDLQRDGFTIGHFPSSILCSTVGGWLAARGAGQCSGKYGKIEDMVLSIELVDGRGDVTTLRRRASQPNLIPLIIGSEGILGVVTATTLRLHPAPATRGFASFSFPTTEGGWEFLREIFQSGLRPAVARLYDPFDAAIAKRGAVKGNVAVDDHAGAHDGHSKVGPIGGGAAVLRSVLRAPKLLNGLIHGLEATELFGAMLVLVFDGTHEETTSGVEAARAIARSRGGEDLGEAPARRWLEHRYAVSYRQPPMIRAGAFLDTMEVAASWKNLAALYRDVRRALGKYAFVMAHLSHVYPDGCSIYFTFAGVGRDEAEAHDKYDRAWRSALEAAIDSGGTLSHHHGVGRSKAPRMGRELGVGIDVVRALKTAFDPAGVLNPGNLIPTRAADEGYVARYEGQNRAVIPARIEIDRVSGLAHSPGSATLANVEAAARADGLTLMLTDDVDCAQSVAAWVAAGTTGAVDTLVDPVDQIVAGVRATLPDGRLLDVRAAPRRAVGPDLIALARGCNDKLVTIDSASLRLHRLDGRGRATAPVTVDRDPTPNDGESRLIEAIATAMRSMP